MADVELEVHQTVELVESPDLDRRSSSSSSKSSVSSSSSSNSPSKTIAEVDLSLPLSQQIVSELQSGDFRFSANYFSHITGQLPTNNSYIYEIEEEEGSGTEYSSEEVVDEEEDGLRVVGSPLIKQAMPVTFHTDSHSPSSSSPCSSPEPPHTPMPPPVASLHPTPVLAADDPARPRFLSDIAEGSEPVHRSSSSSSSTEDSTVIRGDPNLDRWNDDDADDHDHDYYDNDNDNYDDDDDDGQVEGGGVEEEQQRDHLGLHLHHEDEAEH